MKQEHLEFIKELGLTKTESKVYLTLLETGTSLAGTISSISKIYRKNVYDALEALSKKGLVSSKFQEKKRYWTAANPERIQSILKEKLGFFNSILPELTEQFNKQKPKQTVEVYEGLEGVKSFNNIILKEDKPLYIIGATGNIFKRMKFSIPTYLEETKSRKQPNYLIFTPESDQEGIKRIKKTKNTFCKILPKGFVNATQIYLFGEYSGILIWSEEPLAIVIKSREIHQGFKTYFDFLWKIAKPV